MRVATLNDVVVGYVRGLQPPRVAVPNVDTEIFDLHVAPAHRRAGIGRALVSAFLALARAEALTPVVAWTLAPNFAAAEFYRALGAVEVARYTRRLYGKAFEEIAFQLPDAV